MKKKKAPRKVASVERATLVAARDYLQGIDNEDSDARHLPACFNGEGQSEGMSDAAWDAIRAEQIAEFKRRLLRPRPRLSALKTGIPALDRALRWVTLGADMGEDGAETEPQTGSIRHAVLLVRKMIQLQDDAISGLPEGFADRLRKVDHARKCLHEASQLLKEAGADHLSDLASDLAWAAVLARGADVQVRPLDPENNRLGDAPRIRLTGFAHHDKMPLNVVLWHAKYAGRASDAKRAANGAAVDALKDFIRTDAPERFAIISGLLAVIDFDVSASTVRTVCNGYTPKSQRGY